MNEFLFTGRDEVAEEEHSRVDYTENAVLYSILTPYSPNLIIPDSNLIGLVNIPE